MIEGNGRRVATAADGSDSHEGQAGKEDAAGEGVGHLFYFRIASGLTVCGEGVFLVEKQIPTG